MEHVPRSRHGETPGSVVLDLDGVVYLGETPIPGAAEAITALSSLGWQILFATNNSTATPESVAQILGDRAAVVVDATAIVTSAMATRSYLVGNGIDAVFIVGSRQLEETIRRGRISLVDPQDADAVVVGLDRSLNEATIDAACLALSRGAALVATNTDATFPSPEGLLAGAGTTVSAIADASGSTFVVCGKPHQPMVDLVTTQLTSDNVWMVGDRLETDIAFAKNAGWTSVLALSGVTDSRAAVPDGLDPDFVVDSVADLPTLLAKGTKSIPDEG